MISYGDVNVIIIINSNSNSQSQSQSHEGVFYNLLIHLSNINILSIHAINGTQ
jgi:hypothetical protein